MNQVPKFFIFFSATGMNSWLPLFIRVPSLKGKRSEQKLEHQNVELINTNAELDRFVYSTSHDLRSPLASVLGPVTLIESESKEQHTIEHVKLIKTSINRLNDFIKNILTYSQNNRTELQVEQIYSQVIAEEIVNSLRNMQGAEGIIF